VFRDALPRACNGDDRSFRSQRVRKDVKVADVDGKHMLGDDLASFAHA